MIPTVKIKDGDDDFAIINESDFNEERHELFDGPEKGPEPTEVNRKQVKSLLKSLESDVAMNSTNDVLVEELLRILNEKLEAEHDDLDEALVAADVAGIIDIPSEE